MTKRKAFQFTRFDLEQLKNFELIKQGAEARVYLGKYEDTQAESTSPDQEKTAPVEVIVKERFKKTYRHPELDKSLTSKRIKNEVKLLQKAKTLDINVPAVIKADLLNGVICMEYIKDSVTCKDFIVNLVKEKEVSEHKSILNDLAHKIGEIIGKLHSNSVVHGDLTTSNMLVVKDSETTTTSVDTAESCVENIKIYFIDFGLSQVVSNQAEDKAVDLYVLERALLSTHSLQAKGIFEYILKGYVSGNETEANRVIERFEAVRLRGRKRSMIG